MDILKITYLTGLSPGSKNAITFIILWLILATFDINLDKGRPHIASFVSTLIYYVGTLSDMCYIAKKLDEITGERLSKRGRVSLGD